MGPHIEETDGRQGREQAGTPPRKASSVLSTRSAGSAPRSRRRDEQGDLARAARTREQQVGHVAQAMSSTKTTAPLTREKTIRIGRLEALVEV